MSNKDKQQETIKNNENYSLITNTIDEQLKSPLNDLQSTIDSYNTFKKMKFEPPLQELQNKLKENSLSNQLRSQLQIPTLPTINIEKIYPGLTSFSLAMSNLVKTQMTIFTPEIIEAFTNPIIKILKQFSEMQQTYLKNITKVITGISKNDYFNPLIETIKNLQENPNNLFNWMNYYHKLNDYFWIMPYQMKPEELHKILKTIDNEKEFDKVLVKHFNKKRIKNLTEEIMNKLSTKQEQKLFQQVLDSYNSKNYALASIGILSIIDNCLSYYLINKGSSARINMFKPIIEDLENNDDGTSLIFIVMMIDNNINRLYEQIEFNQKISIKTNKKARRNPSAHGKSYSNKKIDNIMLMNTLYYLLDKKYELNKYKNSLYQENKTFKIATKQKKRELLKKIKEKINSDNH